MPTATPRLSAALDAHVARCARRERSPGAPDRDAEGCADPRGLSDHQAQDSIVLMVADHVTWRQSLRRRSAGAHAKRLGRAEPVAANPARVAWQSLFGKGKSMCTYIAVTSNGRPSSR